MIPDGATHIARPGTPIGLFAEYIKVEGNRAFSFRGRWISDDKVVEFLEFYTKIDDMTETPEEKEIFDRWPSERRIDIIATNGNTGEHYCDKKE